MRDLGDFTLISKASDDELMSNNAEAVLSAKEYREFVIAEIVTVGNHGLKLVGLVPPDPVVRMERRLNLSLLHHVLVNLYDSEANESVTRPYTPTTHPHVFGRFEIMVRLYEGGTMSRLFRELRVGSKIHMRGPIDGEVMFTPGKVSPVEWVVPVAYELHPHREAYILHRLEW